MSTQFEDLWTVVRLAAEGSDWKRDEGETLSAWAQRTLRKRSADVDGERWRKIAPYLTVYVDPHSWEEPVSQKGNRTTYEKKHEWYWRIDFSDKAWELGSTTNNEESVPKTAEQAVDSLPSNSKWR